MRIADIVSSLVVSKVLSIFLCTFGIALSQASSSAVMGGTVVVVGATVLLVVLAWDAAVDSSAWPHPPTSTTSRAAAARRAAGRLALAGMANAPFQRGNAARIARTRHTVSASQSGTGPQLQRPPVTTHPARPVGQRLPRVAVRSPRWERYTLPCLRSRTRQTGKLS